MWSYSRDAGYSFYVLDKNGNRFMASLIRVIDLDNSPPIPVDAYMVNNEQYTPKEFWDLFSLVPETDNEG